jgi:hypothetical protein
MYGAKPPAGLSPHLPHWNSGTSILSASVTFWSIFMFWMFLGLFSVFGLTTTYIFLSIIKRFRLLLYTPSFLLYTPSFVIYSVFFVFFCLIISYISVFHNFYRNISSSIVSVLRRYDDLSISRSPTIFHRGQSLISTSFGKTS